MTVYAIPLNAIPAQRLSVSLGSQPVNLVIYQRSTGIYADVSLAGRQIATGAACLNAVPIVRYAYEGFTGDLYFYDTTGAGDDPSWDGLGARWQLAWDDGL